MTSLIEIEKIPKKDLERIKQMYFLGFSLEEITHQFPVSVKTLRFYVFGVSDDGTDPLCWYKQKKEVDKTGVMPYIRGKVDALEKATGMAYRLLTRGLEGVAERVDSGDYQFTVDEVKKLSDVVANLDKLVRLETGKPTDINEVVNISLKEAREILRNDPFIMAEYKEVKKEEVALEEIDFGESPFER